MDSDPSQALWGRVHGPGELGVFLREARLAADLTQDRLADEIGVDRRYIYQLESGQVTLYATRLFAVLRELGVDMELRVRDDA
jgi:HTH-type transcriptional regulator / antitoxin HipB